MLVKLTELVLLVSALACSQAFVFGNSVTKLYEGTISPLDPDVCTSQNVTFTCTLLSPPKLNHSVGFAVKNGSTNNLYVAVESREVTQINETVALFTIYNINVTSSIYIYVRCFYWERFGDTDKSLQLGDTTTASVYTMPKKIENISCLVENYFETLNCTWDYGIEYTIKPDVVFHWRIPEYSASWNNCAELSTEYGYCFWNSSRAGDFTMKKIEINITLEEVCGVSVSSNFTVFTYLIVKPDPVIKLTSTVLNSTCIEVSWQTNNSVQEYPKEHKVVITSKWGHPKELTFKTTAQTEKLPHVKTFCELVPFTEYTFTVSIQPTGHQAGFYSEPRTTEAKTYSDIPSSSPVLTKGGYSWKPKDCQENNPKRRVCVFWEPISEEDKNGPMKGLKGKYIAVNNAKTVIEEDWAEDLTYGCSSELLCNTSYTFTIKARNENGTSQHGSTLQISSATSGISQPHFIVESTNTSDVLVSWTYPEDKNIENFLVVRCRKNNNGDCENEHEVQWNYFPEDVREATIRTAKNSALDFLYGVSAVTNLGSSGVEWQDCVYVKDKVPTAEPENVVVSKGSEDNTLVVTWDKLPCVPGEPYIALYNVQYNKLNDASRNSQNVTASGQARLVLRDLEEDRTYVVTVRGITKDELYGPESHPATGIPVNKSLKADAIVGIVMGSLLVVIFAGIGCFCLISSCKNKAKMRLENTRKITIPNHEDMGPIIDESFDSATDKESSKSIERQDSDDSGIYPMTPQLDKCEDPLKFSNKENIPPDYVRVTEDQGRPRGTEVNTNLPYSIHNHIDFAPPQRVATVGFVLHKKTMSSSETNVKNVGSDISSGETSAKKRAKNVSGDSGVSDGYSKATKLQENSLDNDAYENDDDNETTEHKAGTNDAKTSVEANKSTDVLLNEGLSEKPGFETESPGIIHEKSVIAHVPKPVAFSGQSDSNCSLSEREDDTFEDTGVESTPDYTQVKMIDTSVPCANIGTDNPPSLELDQSIQHEPGIPVLTVIPCPVLDETDTSSEEDENALINEKIDGQNPGNKMDLCDSLEDQCKPAQNYISLENSLMSPSEVPASPVNNSALQGHKTAPGSDYVAMATSSADVSSSLKSSSYVLQTNSDGFSLTAFTSNTNVTDSIPAQALFSIAHNSSDSNPISQSETDTYNQNLNVSVGYVTSVTTPSSLPTSLLQDPLSAASQAVQNLPYDDAESHAPSVTALTVSPAGGYVPHSSAAGGFDPSNSVQECTAQTSAPNSMTFSGHVPNLGYIPHPSTVPGLNTVSPIGGSSSTYVSPSNTMYTTASSYSTGYVPHCSPVQNMVSPSSTGESGYVTTSQNASISNTSILNSSGYVSNPDLLTASLPSGDREVPREPDNNLSSSNDLDFQSTGNLSDNGDQSQLSNDSEVPISHAPAIHVSQQQQQRQNVSIRNMPSLGYVDETFAKNQDKIYEMTADTSGTTSEQTNSLGTEEISQTNGYVPHQFIYQEVKNTTLPTNDSEPHDFEMRNVLVHESMGEREETRGENNSDSGLSSLE